MFPVRISSGQRLQNTKQLSDSPERKSWGSEFRPSGKGQWIQSRMVWDAGVGQIKIRDKIRNQKILKNPMEKKPFMSIRGGIIWKSSEVFTVPHSILSLSIFPCLLHRTTKSSAMTANSCCVECRGCYSTKLRRIQAATSCGHSCHSIFPIQEKYLSMQRN